MAASKIFQGPDNGERLFTVRPRNVKSVTDKRGTPSSIRFNLPPDLKKNLDAYGSNLTPAEATAFSQSVNEEGLGFINFIAQSTSYTIQEKSQIMHTFGAQEAVYFYGRAPVMVQLSGTLVDDIDNNQFAQFMGLYNKFLRGSSASKEYSYVTLSLNNAVFVGSFVNISVQQSSDRDTDVTFSAQFLAKTFTIVSADTVFADGKADYTSPVRVREKDPTLTREKIQSIIDNNELVRVNTTSSADNKVVFKDDNQGFFGDIPKSFGKLPTLEGLLGFSISDVVDFFDIVTDTIDNVLAPFIDLLNQIDEFAKGVIALIDAVEDFVDDILNLIDSVVKLVFGVIDTLKDVYTKLVNFPKSISNKIGSFGKPGGSPLKIAGSSSISSEKAITLLSAGSNIGSARGTPEGAAAALSVAKSSSESASLSKSDSAASLSVNKGSAPSLSVGSGSDNAPSIGGNTSLPSLGGGGTNQGGDADAPPILIVGG